MSIPPHCRPGVSLKTLWLSVFTYAFFGASVLAQPPTTASPALQWPRFLNSDFSGSVNAVGMAARQWNVEPKLDWTIPVGDGYGLGVVQEGAYFHFDASERTERIRMIAMDSGKTIWERTYELNYRDLYGYETGPRCSPTCDGDLVFSFGAAGMLTAWAIDDGTKLWQVDTNEKYSVVQNFFGVGSAPLVLGDLVIVMVGGSPVADQAIAPGRLDRVSPNGSLAVAFDRSTGKELWRCGNDLASYSSPRTMQIDGQDYVLMLAREHLHLIDPRQGKSIGQTRFRADILESVNAMTPVVEGTRVLIGDCYDLGSVVFDVKIEDGQADFNEVWRDPENNRRNQSLRSHLSTPVLCDGHLYACSGRNAPDSDFRCVEFATGKVKWTALDRRRSTATRVGEILLVLKETGPLHIVRCTPDEYDELAVWNLDQSDGDRPAITYPCWAAPVVVGEQVLIRGDGDLLCLRLPDPARR
ncbi:outer membrane protein assembly factor BamB family protein [Neorhodopirellula pilleata]|uniref:Outer membrane biogenesis protein BamB n=1 Tax=Neorhodopirellula pilleata TaxID=2714738 RepID=A0A5C6AVK1_9BACT|nr:PQQ-binding-like beta-propeller repeat protein [Neorhodopirellula pilleata]TWU03618.1 outer membrane biogenesis protein BamB [Neorhodopirellula pilleata]